MLFVHWLRGTISTVQDLQNQSVLVIRRTQWPLNSPSSHDGLDNIFRNSGLHQSHRGCIVVKYIGLLARQGRHAPNELHEAVLSSPKMLDGVASRAISLHAHATRVGRPHVQSGVRLDSVNLPLVTSPSSI